MADSKVIAERLLFMLTNYEHDFIITPEQFQEILEKIILENITKSDKE